MRAVMLREFGAPEQLAVEDVPDPVAGPGQALVAVAAAGITFVETQIRAGTGPNPAHRPPLPLILGNGIAGTVRSVGTGVDTTLVGAPVVSTTGGSGGYAELVAVNAADLIPVPPALDLTDALALLNDGRTALGLVRAAAPADGEWVLVEAAGGGVGSLLVQLARNAGARVIAAASGPSKLRLAQECGAEAGVDYSAPDWADQLRGITGGRGVDVVFDSVGGDVGASAFELVRDGGRFCVTGMASGAMTRPPEDEVRRRGLTIVTLAALPRAPEQVRELATAALAEAAAGRLRPTVGQTFPLEHAAKAHAAMEARATVGKTLLIP